MVQRTYVVQADKKAGLTKQAHWSDKQKYEAVTLYKLLGSLPLVASNCQVPLTTLRYWFVQDWWKEFESEIGSADKAKLTGRLGKIRDSAMTVVEDRLDNGDYHYDQKTGQIVRKPINAHVANKIMNDSVDRSILLEKLSNEKQIATTQEKIADRLLKLQSDFEKMAKKRPTAEIIDVQATQVPPDVVATQEGAIPAFLGPISNQVQDT